MSPKPHVVIIHDEDCPLCERAIKRYRDMGIEPELYRDWSEMHWDLRAELAAELTVNDIDITKSIPLPVVFENRRLMKKVS